MGDILNTGKVPGDGSFQPDFTVVATGKKPCFRPAGPPKDKQPGVCLRERGLFVPKQETVC